MAKSKDEQDFEAHEFWPRAQARAAEIVAILDKAPGCSGRVTAREYLLLATQVAQCEGSIGTPQAQLDISRLIDLAVYDHLVAREAAS